jgi:hypothetical protein
MVRREGERPLGLVCSCRELAGRWVERTEQNNTNVNYAISDQPLRTGMGREVRHRALNTYPIVLAENGSGSAASGVAIALPLGGLNRIIRALFGQHRCRAAKAEQYRLADNTDRLAARRTLTRHSVCALPGLPYDAIRRFADDYRHP